MKKHIFTIILCIFLLCALTLPAAAEIITPKMTDLFSVKWFRSSNGYSMYYRLYLPEDYSEDKDYPVILFLHGAGERGTDNVSQLKLGIIEPFRNTEHPIYDCIVVAPQCPKGSKWVNVEAWTDVNYSTDSIAESFELASVYELMTKLGDTYSTDKDRYYVTGLSMGGFATWDIIVRHPDMFAAAAPVCGGADSRKADIIKDIPIRTYHGLLDSTVPYLGTATMAQKLRDAGARDFEYITYPNSNHDIWTAVYARADLFDWMLTQKLSDRPLSGGTETEQTTTTTDETTVPIVDAPEQTTQETIESMDAVSDTTTHVSSGCGASLHALPIMLIGASAVIAKKRKKK